MVMILRGGGCDAAGAIAVSHRHRAQAFILHALRALDVRKRLFDAA